MLSRHADVLFWLARFAHEHWRELFKYIPIGLVFSVELAMRVSPAPQLVH